MREAFALQKLLSLFNKKYWCNSDITNRNFNETLTNDVVSFEQPGPGIFIMETIFMTSCLPLWKTLSLDVVVHSQRKDFAPNGANSSPKELISIDEGAQIKIRQLYQLVHRLQTNFNGSNTIGTMTISSYRGSASQ